MKGETMIELDRWLQSLADENKHINHTYDELVNLSKIETGIELKYEQAADAVTRGKFTCNSTRGYQSVKALTFANFRSANIQRLHSTPKFEQCKNWTSDQWLKAFIGEVGELCNMLKKVDRGDYAFHEVIGDVGDEIADIQTYLDLWAASLKIDLGAVTVCKFNRVSDKVDSEVKL